MVRKNQSEVTEENPLLARAPSQPGYGPGSTREAMSISHVALDIDEQSANRATQAVPPTEELADDRAEQLKKQALASMVPRARAAPVLRPSGTRVQLERSGTRLDIVIPPRGFTDNGKVFFGRCFIGLWLTLVAVWTVRMVYFAGFYALISVPFWLVGAFWGRSYWCGALTCERFVVGPQEWWLGTQQAVFWIMGKVEYLAGKNVKFQEGATQTLSPAWIVTIPVHRSRDRTAIELLTGVDRIRFGLALEPSVQQWLVQEINEHIAALKGSDVDFALLPAPGMPQVLNDRECNSDSDDV